MIGFIGSFLLAICGIFEVFKSIKTKRCDLGWAFLLSWCVGEVLLFRYVWKSKDIPLLINYGGNIIFTLILTWYKLFPKEISER